jgi:hypothetical protein
MRRPSIVGAVIACLCLLALLTQFPGRAEASRREADDLRREIDAQRAAVIDLERLDADRAVPDEIANLKTWLDEATGQLGKEEMNRVREVLDRCIAQAELIRQKINAAKLTAQMRDRDAALKRLREKIERTRQQLQQTTVAKKAMEMNAK